MTTIDLRYVHCPTSASCNRFLTKWSEWCYQRNHSNLALCEVTPNYTRTVLNDKSRNMVRKAGRHFHFFKFDYNQHLDDMFDINISKRVRQGSRMTESYTERPTPIMVQDLLCKSVHADLWFGAFDAESKLRAYTNVAVIGEVAIINRILGHGDFLTFGVMNGLIAALVALLVDNTAVRWLNYLDLESCREGLRKFKESVGFRTHQVCFEY